MKRILIFLLMGNVIFGQGTDIITVTDVGPGNSGEWGIQYVTVINPADYVANEPTWYVLHYDYSPPAVGHDYVTQQANNRCPMDSPAGPSTRWHYPGCAATGGVYYRTYWKNDGTNVFGPPNGPYWGVHCIFDGCAFNGTYDARVNYVHLYIHPGSGAKKKICYDIKNNDIFSHNYSAGCVAEVGIDGTTHFVVPGQSMTLAPGQSGTICVEVGTDPWSFDNNTFPDPSQDCGVNDVQMAANNSTNLAAYPNNDSTNMTVQSSMNPTNGVPIYNATPNAGSTNAGIIFSPLSQTNAAQAVQESGQALFTLAAQEASIAQTNAAAQLGMIGGVGTNIVGALLGTGGQSGTQSVVGALNGISSILTGAFGTNGQGGGNGQNVLESNVWVKNFKDATNLSQQATLVGISNILSGGTNDFATNVEYEFSGVTNWDQALGVTSPLDIVQQWFADQVSSLVIPEVDEGGTPQPMVLDFSGFGVPGTQIDFNPLDNAGIADIFYWAKALIQWLICVYYCKRCMADSRWAISVCNQTHGTMNPSSIRQRN